METFLVTGGIGFLGTNLCLRLLNDDHKVVCMDNFYTGRKDNLDLLSKHKNFYFIEHDITHPLPLHELQNISFIYNLACPASPPKYQADPLYTAKVSVYGLFNLIELAKQNQIPLFQASTSEVYGDPLEHPQKETYFGNVNPIGPRSSYDVGKRMAESILLSHHQATGLPVKIARVFNTYGPYMDPYDGRVISNFILQTLKNECITVYGSGQQTRSFCYVDDTLDAFIKLAQSSTSVVQPMNVGNPSEISILELAKKIIQLTGAECELKHLTLPTDDPKLRRPDISYAKETLHWSPEVQLEEGLQKCIEYFKKTSPPDRSPSI